MPTPTLKTNVNREIADLFNAIGDFMELRNVPWKPRAYHMGARSLQVLGRDVGEIYREGGLKALEEIPGIGEGLGKKIIQYLRTGKIQEYESMKRARPAGLRELMEVPGLGPKKAKILHDKLYLRSLSDLKAALQEHKVAHLPGFGEKSEQKIAENLGIARPHTNRMSRSQALPTAERIVSLLKPLKFVDRVEIVGSLRRKEESVGDIDLLVISFQPDLVMRAFSALPLVAKVLLQGPKKSSVLLKNGMQADLRVFEPKHYGAAMLYFTGNKQHNIELRRLAIARGWKLNEYGLFDKGDRPLAGGTEEGVYQKLGYRFIPPEERRNQGELEAHRLS
jgi:DNA polymerase (family 10)